MKNLLPFLCAFSIFLTGCQEQNEEDKAQQPATAPVSVAPVIPPKINPEIMANLEALLINCKVDERGWVHDCKNKEYDALIDKLKDYKDPTKLKITSLDTFSQALSSENKQLNSAAAGILSSSEYWKFRDAKIGDISKDVAKRLLDAVDKLPKELRNRAIVPTVHASMLAGEEAALYAMLEKHNDAPKAYYYLMQYARLAAFPKVQTLADSTDRAIAKAAIASPRKMASATAEEKAAVCPWAEAKIKDNISPTFGEYGDLLLWCKGSSIDLLLDEGEKRLAQNIFSREDSFLFRSICFSPIKGLIPEVGKEAQCTRVLTFLEKAVNTETLEPLPRGLALFAIYYQRRNADSMAIMKKYKDHKVPEIQKYAKESIESLVKSYKIAK